jgi:hypothetical protein
MLAQTSSSTTRSSAAVSASGMATSSSYDPEHKARPLRLFLTYVKTSADFCLTLHFDVTPM